MTWQALAESHVPLARRIARRTSSRMPLPLGDLESAAMLGLVQAAKSYDPSRGAFEPFAERRIIGAIQDEARAVDELSRPHREAVKAGRAEAPRRLEFDESVVIGQQAHGGDVERRLAGEDVRRALAFMPKRLQFVARRYYLEEVTLGEIGNSLGVTESRACQLLKEAEAQLAVRLLPCEPVDEDARRRFLALGQRRRTRCMRGHALTGYNVIETRTGRGCRRCRLESARRRRRAVGAQHFSKRIRRHALAKLTNDRVRVVLAMLAKGERVSSIARRLNVSGRVVRLILRGETYRDVPRPPCISAHRPPRGKLTEAQAGDIFRRLNGGERARHLAREYGVSPTTIGDIRRGRQHVGVTGGAALPDGRRGVRCARSKLNDDQVAEARAALAAGETTASVARRMGVSFQSMASLRDGKTYRRVPCQRDLANQHRAA